MPLMSYSTEIITVSQMVPIFKIVAWIWQKPEPQPFNHRGGQYEN